jgi:hypothetical protein
MRRGTTFTELLLSNTSCKIAGNYFSPECSGKYLRCQKQKQKLIDGPVLDLRDLVSRKRYRLSGTSRAESMDTRVYTARRSMGSETICAVIFYFLYEKIFFVFVFSSLLFSLNEVLRTRALMSQMQHFLQAEGIIVKQSSTKAGYRLDDTITRAEVVGMALKIK